MLGVLKRVLQYHRDCATVEVLVVQLVGIKFYVGTYQVGILSGVVVPAGTPCVWVCVDTSKSPRLCARVRFGVLWFADRGQRVLQYTVHTYTRTRTYTYEYTQEKRLKRARTEGARAIPVRPVVLRSTPGWVVEVG